jgi:hypothetical protein
MALATSLTLLPASAETRAQCSPAEWTEIQSMYSDCGGCVTGGPCPATCCGAASTPNQGLVCRADASGGGCCIRVFGLSASNDEGRVFSTDTASFTGIVNGTCDGVSTGSTTCSSNCALAYDCSGVPLMCTAVEVPGFSSAFSPSGECDTRGSGCTATTTVPVTTDAITTVANVTTVEMSTAKPPKTTTEKLTTKNNSTLDTPTSASDGRSEPSRNGADKSEGAQSRDDSGNKNSSGSKNALIGGTVSIGVVACLAGAALLAVCNKKRSNRSESSDETSQHANNTGGPVGNSLEAIVGMTDHGSSGSDSNFVHAPARHASVPHMIAAEYIVPSLAAQRKAPAPAGGLYGAPGDWRQGPDSVGSANNAPDSIGSAINAPDPGLEVEYDMTGALYGPNVSAVTTGAPGYTPVRGNDFPPSAMHAARVDLHHITPSPPAWYNGPSGPGAGGGL